MRDIAENILVYIKGGETMSDFMEQYAAISGVEHVQRIYQEGILAAQIKRARKERKLSQQDLADLAHLPKSTIGRIEAGITSPKVSTLLQLSKALGTPFIIDGTTKPYPTEMFVNESK